MTVCLPRPLLVGLAVAAAGCGDSLYGDRLDALYPGFPVPEDPVVEVRWFGGGEVGTHAPCATPSAEVLGYLTTFERGVAVVRISTDLQPTAWFESSEWRFSLGHLLLVDGSGPDRTTSARFPMDALWGLPFDQLVLVAEGDMVRLSDDLGVIANSDGDRVQEGVQVVHMGSPESAWNWMSELSMPHRVDLDSDHADVNMLNHGLALPAAQDMAMGKGPGGLTFEDCAQ